MQWSNAPPGAPDLAALRLRRGYVEAYRIRGGLDEEAFAAVIDARFRRHDAPRTTIQMVDGEPVKGDPSGGVRSPPARRPARSAALAEPAFQNLDYVPWQRQFIETAAMRVLIANAKQRLAKVQPMALPFDHPEPREVSTLAHPAPLPLDDAFWSAVDALARATPRARRRSASSSTTSCCSPSSPVRPRCARSCGAGTRWSSMPIATSRSRPWRCSTRATTDRSPAQR